MHNMITLRQYWHNGFRIVLLPKWGNMKKRRMRSIEKALHIITVLILLLKATDLLKKNLFFPASIILMLAFTTLAILLFRRKMRIRPRHAGIICFYLESPALLVISYSLYLEKKEMLPYIFFIAGLIYPMVGFIASKKFKQIKKPPVNRRLY